MINIPINLALRNRASTPLHLCLLIVPGVVKAFFAQCPSAMTSLAIDQQKQYVRPSSTSFQK